MDGLLQDIGVAVRSLMRRPGFTLVVVLSLAVGIGANTAIFSVAKDVLLRPFPYPDKVVSVFGHTVGRVGFSGNVTYPNIFDIGESAQSFEMIGVARYWSPTLEDDRGATVMRGATVTSNYFHILGVETRMVLPGARSTLAVPLVRGRLLLETDLLDQPPVAVIDQNLADAMWAGEDALGKRFAVHGNVHEVVGIVGNLLHFGPGGTVRPQLYLHAAQDGWNGVSRGLTILARGSSVGSLVAPIRAAVAAVNASIAVGTVEALGGYLGKPLSASRFRTGLMAAFGLTALLLAVLGIAGVMAYSVSRRTREMGIRLALGAEAMDVRRLVLREGVRLIFLGVTIGVTVALGVARSTRCSSKWVRGTPACTSPWLPYSRWSR
jgi:hypothetical protein